MTAEPIFARVGGAEAVRALVAEFYAVMARDEPVLARLHPVDEAGQVLPDNQTRFADFLIGWLGGPQDYIAVHGHPRLRMRHARVRVDAEMRDAWVRCMTKAMQAQALDPSLRTELERSFYEVADFLRNA